MSLPSGEVVARPVLIRACGCAQEFQHYAVDRFRAVRQAKFEATRCPACAAKLAERHELVPKQEAFARLPAGSRLTMTRLPDGSWSGGLTAGGATVEAERPGPQALTAALAQLWAGTRPAGDVDSQPPVPAVELSPPAGRQVEEGAAAGATPPAGRRTGCRCGGGSPLDRS